jgi:hypothetical protein
MNARRSLRYVITLVPAAVLVSIGTGAMAGASHAVPGSLHPTRPHPTRYQLTRHQPTRRQPTRRQPAEGAAIVARADSMRSCNVARLHGSARRMPWMYASPDRMPWMYASPDRMPWMYASPDRMPWMYASPASANATPCPAGAGSPVRPGGAPTAA